MCKSSIEAKRVRDAKIGELLSISVRSHNMGVFHRTHEGADTCVTCVQNGERLTFFDVPHELQVKFDIDETAVATFQDNGDNEHDIVNFDNGEHGVVLCELAGYGIIVHVGALDTIGCAPSPSMRKESMLEAA